MIRATCSTGFEKAGGGKGGSSARREGSMAKFMSLAEAIAENVRDGDTVAMEGFTHLIPFAAGHEVIRQGRKSVSFTRPGNWPRS